MLRESKKDSDYTNGAMELVTKEILSQVLKKAEESGRKMNNLVVTSTMAILRMT